MSRKSVLMYAGCAVMAFVAVAFAPRRLAVPPSASLTQNQYKDFPAPPFMLANARDHARDPTYNAAIQHHAWNLLEQFGKDDTSFKADSSRDEITHLHPAWQGWLTKCSQLQLSAKCPAVEAGRGQPTLALERKVQRANKETVKKGTAAAPPYSSVYYSPAVAGWMLKAKINVASSLFKMLTTTGVTGPGGSTLIPGPPPPDDSAIIKEIWAVVSDDGSGAWNVPVYDQTRFNPDAMPETLGTLYDWKTTVRLKVTGTAGATSVDTEAQCKPSLPDGISANCFVYRYAPQHCSKIMNIFDSAPSSDLLEMQKPCIFLLLGVQIITREYLSNWTWNTYWWTETPNATPNNSGWDANAPEGFKHFEMATMLGPDSISAASAQHIFNPYLEGPMTGGPATNCLLCHSQASYIPDSDQTPTASRNGQHISDPDADLIQDSPNQTKYQDCTTDQRKEPATNHCRLRTALLWSLATNQDPTAPFSTRLSDPLPSLQHSSGLASCAFFHLKAHSPHSTH